jgi:hypothetical protein
MMAQPACRRRSIGSGTSLPNDRVVTRTVAVAYLVPPQGESEPGAVFSDSQAPTLIPGPGLGLPDAAPRAYLFPTLTTLRSLCFPFSIWTTLTSLKPSPPGVKEKVPRTPV